MIETLDNINREIIHPRDLSSKAYIKTSFERLRPRPINLEDLNIANELNPNIRYSEKDDIFKNSAYGISDRMEILETDSAKSPFAVTEGDSLYGSIHNGYHSIRGNSTSKITLKKDNQIGNSPFSGSYEDNNIEFETSDDEYFCLNKRRGKIEMIINCNKKSGQNNKNPRTIHPIKKVNNKQYISNPTSSKNRRLVIGIENRKFIIRIQRQWRKLLKYRENVWNNAVRIQSFFRSYKLRKRVYLYLYHFFSIQKLENTLRNLTFKRKVVPLFNHLKLNFAIKHKLNLENNKASIIQKFVLKRMEKNRLRKTSFINSLQAILHKIASGNFNLLISGLKSKYLSEKLLKNQKALNIFKHSIRSFIFRCFNKSINKKDSLRAKFLKKFLKVQIKQQYLTLIRSQFLWFKSVTDDISLAQSRRYKLSRLFKYAENRLSIINTDNLKRIYGDYRLRIRKISEKHILRFHLVKNIVQKLDSFCNFTVKVNWIKWTLKDFNIKREIEQEKKNHIINCENKVNLKNRYLIMFLKNIKLKNLVFLQKIFRIYKANSVQNKIIETQNENNKNERISLKNRLLRSLVSSKNFINNLNLKINFLRIKSFSFQKDKPSSENVKTSQIEIKPNFLMINQEVHADKKSNLMINQEIQVDEKPNLMINQEVHVEFKSHSSLDSPKEIHLNKANKDISSTMKICKKTMNSINQIEYIIVEATDTIETEDVNLRSKRLRNNKDSIEAPIEDDKTITSNLKRLSTVKVTIGKENSEKTLLKKYFDRWLIINLKQRMIPQIKRKFNPHHFEKESSEASLLPKEESDVITQPIKHIQVNIVKLVDLKRELKNCFEKWMILNYKSKIKDFCQSNISSKIRLVFSKKHYDTSFILKTYFSKWIIFKHKHASETEKSLHSLQLEYSPQEVSNDLAKESYLVREIDDLVTPQSFNREENYAPQSINNDENNVPKSFDTVDKPSPAEHDKPVILDNKPQRPMKKKTTTPIKVTVIQENQKGNEEDKNKLKSYFHRWTISNVKAKLSGFAKNNCLQRVKQHIYKRQYDTTQTYKSFFCKWAIKTFRKHQVDANIDRKVDSGLVSRQDSFEMTRVPLSFTCKSKPVTNYFKIASSNSFSLNTLQNHEMIKIQPSHTNKNRLQNNSHNTYSNYKLTKDQNNKIAYKPYLRTDLFRILIKENYKVRIKTFISAIQIWKKNALKLKHEFEFLRKNRFEEIINNLQKRKIKFSFNSLKSFYYNIIKVKKQECLYSIFVNANNNSYLDLMSKIMNIWLDYHAFRGQEIKNQIAKDIEFVVEHSNAIDKVMKGLNSNKSTFMRRLMKLRLLHGFLQKTNSLMSNRRSYHQAFAVNILHHNYTIKLEKQYEIAKNKHERLDLSTFIKYPLLIYIIGAFLEYMEMCDSLFPSKVNYKIASIHPMVLVYITSMLILIYQMLSFFHVKRSNISIKETTALLLNKAKSRTPIDLITEYERILKRAKDYPYVSETSSNLLTTKETDIGERCNTKQENENFNGIITMENFILIDEQVKSSKNLLKCDKTFELKDSDEKMLEIID